VAIDSGHADHGPDGAISLGELLEEQGDAEGARATYQQAIDSGHPNHASRAALKVGRLLENQGDTDGARAAYQKAIDSGGCRR
jgi:TolA-binding protein